VELRGLEPLTSSMPWWPRQRRRRAASVVGVHRRAGAATSVRPGSPSVCPSRDRQLEFLRDDDALTQLAAEKRGLSSPELCMLMAYAKISVTEQLLSIGLADDEPWLAQVRRDCFPQRPGRALRSCHERAPALGEIITVSIVKYVIDNFGVVPPPGFRRRPSPPSS
jgi:hypothetical protein